MLAVAVILQSLRLVLPLPLIVTTYFIGILVNMILVLTFMLNGFKAALLLACLLPVFAYFEGQLLLPFLLPVVICGNVVLLYLFSRFQYSRFRLVLPSLGKVLVMFCSACLGLFLFGLMESAVCKAVLYAMSIPQFVTSLAGIWAAGRMYVLLENKI